jgi:hypothetical protein
LGGEYQSLNSFFQGIGIEHHVSCPYAHQQNGSAERKHRHIIEVGLTLLAHSSMPLKFWDEPLLLPFFSSIDCHPKSLTTTHPMSVYLEPNLITPSFVHLVVPFGPT